MARVSVDKELLMNLLNYKLNHLKEEIDLILNKWNYSSSTEFLKHAKDGTLSEAEMDAIELINLNDERERLLAEKTSITPIESEESLRKKGPTIEEFHKIFNQSRKEDMELEK